jgi:hypothetical protein
MSDSFWVFLGLVLTAIVNGYVSLKTKKAVETTAADAANKLVMTNSATDSKLAKIDKTTNDVHTLVNSNMGTQLRLAAVALRRLADLTKEQADIDAATLAEEMLDAHVKKQEIVDSGGTTPNRIK